MRRLFFVALAMVFLGGAGHADDLHKNDWSFNFFNDSRQAVTQISTIQRNGEWSRNWLREPMDRGTGLTLSFKDKGDTRCSVRTYVKFSDGSFYDRDIDYCGIAIVRVTSKRLTTE
ncbi:hypothetical protein [Jiella pelagia]|uniref:Uncharacterized protein n=1 Tax=Jiella pelagia TaxID=2986949 RepID=A0ABY7C300_9HYPH|nr:hypothetical protein [Jiella pelagia]WAP69409.1 hypothetical protein OH818_03780 [Jiella pelagia]